MREEIGKISIYGSKREIEEAKKLLNTIPDLHELPEPDARFKLQDMIDEYRIKADILYDGNTVYSKKRIIRNLRQIIRAGVLGYASYTSVGSMLRVPTMTTGKPVLSDYFYEFLHLSCGSIAHYNKAGWIAEYTTVEDLREFFLKNEFGVRVINHLPEWQTDAIRVVEEIEELLGISMKKQDSFDRELAISEEDLTYVI